MNDSDDDDDDSNETWNVLFEGHSFFLFFSLSIIINNINNNKTTK